MNYLGELTSQLRYKNYSTDEIIGILADVRTHAEAAGSTPADSFGDVEEYPKQKKITMFKAVLNIAYGVIFFVWLVVFFVLRRALGDEAVPRPWIVAAVALAGVLVVSQIGRLYARRVPRQPSR